MPAEDEMTADEHVAGGEPDELQQRVDRLLESALRQQLSDQQALNRFVEGIDDALTAVRHELGEMRVAVARALAAAREPSALTPTVDAVATAARSQVEEGIERVEERVRSLRNDLAEHLGTRIAELQHAVTNALRTRDDVDRLSAGALLKRMEELRDQLEARFGDLDLSATTALSDATTALKDQVDALGAVRDDLAGDAGERAQQLRDVAGAVSVLRDQAERLADEHQERVTVVLDRLQSLLEESDAHVRGAIDTVSAQASATVADTLAARVADLDARAERFGRELSEQLDHRLRLLADQASSALERLTAQHLSQAQQATAAELAALREALGNLPHELAAEAGRELAGLREGAAAIGDQLTAAAQGELEGLRRSAASLTERLTTATATEIAALRDSLATLAEQVSALSRHDLRGLGETAKDLAERLERTAREELQGLRTSVDDLRDDVDARAADQLTTVTQTLTALSSQVASAVFDAGEAAVRRANDGVAEHLKLVEDSRSELREAFLATAEEDRARIREALVDLRESAARVGRELHAVMAEQTDAARAHAAAEAATLGREVRGVQAMVNDVSEWVQAALDDHTEKTQHTADSFASRLEAALDHHLSALRAATPDVEVLADEIAQLRRSVDALRGEQIDWFGGGTSS